MAYEAAVLELTGHEFRAAGRDTLGGVNVVHASDPT